MTDNKKIWYTRPFWRVFLFVFSVMSIISGVKQLWAGDVSRGSVASFLVGGFFLIVAIAGVSFKFDEEYKGQGESGSDTGAKIGEDNDEIVIYFYKNYTELVSREIFLNTGENWERIMERKREWEQSEPKNVCGFHSNQNIK